MGSLLVSHEPASAAVVRRAIAADLADRIPQAAIDEIVLVASELVGNAIRHSPPGRDRTLSVEWDLEGSYAVVRVCDAGADTPRIRNAALDEPSGRGLAIVNAVSADWGSQPAPDGGKYVWARVPLAASDDLAAAQ
jgi:two-component sensor histidine kinase